MVPKLKDVKVNLGAWKPKGDAGEVQRMPRGDLLMKAALWTLDEYGQVRANLAAAPLQLEVTESEEVTKIEVAGGTSTVIVIKRDQAMPHNIASMPFGAIVVDARTMSSEEGELLLKMPGRSKFMDMPTIIFGGIAEVEDARRGVVKACSGQWAGEQRTLEIYTKEPNAQYSFHRRRLLLMIPPGVALQRMPPMANIAHADPLTVGWVAVIGLLRFLWHRPADDGQEHATDWLYVMSDDLTLPALLTQRLETNPSIVLCVLHGGGAQGDTGDIVAENMRTAQDLPPIPWSEVIERWCMMLPLVLAKPGVREEEEREGDEGEGEPLTPPEAVPKPKPSPKPRKVTKAKAKAAAASAEEEVPVWPEGEQSRSSTGAMGTALPQPPSPRAERASQKEAAKQAEKERERQRERDRMRRVEEDEWLRRDSD